HPVETIGGRYVNGTCWEVELLPYIEQDSLYKKWDKSDFRNNVADGRNATTAQVLKVLLCPSDPLPPDPVWFIQLSTPQYVYASGFYGLSSYGGNAGRRSVPSWLAGLVTQDGVFFQDSSIRMTDVIDGTSSTFLFGERSHRDLEFDRLALASSDFS